MQVFLVTAEHPEVPGLPLGVFRSIAGANREAARLTNIIRSDSVAIFPALAEATDSNWEYVIGILADHYGAKHCWVDIEELELQS